MTPAVQLSWLVCNQRNCPLQYLGGYHHDTALSLSLSQLIDQFIKLAWFHVLLELQNS